MPNPAKLRSALAIAATCAALALTIPFPAMAQDAVPPADAQTKAIVAAADAFLATLDAAQKTSAMFEFSNATQRTNWTNFPQGGPGANRVGVKWGDMTDAQHAAFTTFLGTILSPKGATMALEQVAADDIVAANDSKEAAGKASNGRPPVSFGSAFYWISFLGTPSTTTPWMLQFGGHHLAINATVVGPNVTLSPSLTGGQPQKFDYNGKPIYIVEQEATEAAAFLASLTVDQRGKAILSPELADLVLGPGKDGMTLQPEGIAGADLTDVQKTAFLALIAARLGMINADDLAAAMADVKANLDQTTFGWWGPTDPVGAAYFRITAPTAIIEFSPQTQDGDPTDHAHNMYRNPANEYGAAWAKLQ